MNLITRQIGIDMGHRIPHHGSKCYNIHGHRYTIEAAVTGDLFEEGEQTGMVLDFGFLKDEMMEHIDKPCDHGTCFWIGDDLMWAALKRATPAEGLVQLELYGEWGDRVHEEVGFVGHCATTGRGGTKIYVVNFVPTAENLAKHWFERLAPRVVERTENKGRLAYVKVWETPNCFAIFQP